jgi:hypothetical protein
VPERDDEGFNLDALRISDVDVVAITAAQAKAKRKAKTSRPGRHFVLVPLEWLERLAGAKNLATLKLALHLLYLHWRGQGRPVTLSNVAASQAGVSRGQKWRALAELEALDLIIVRRRTRRSPEITLQKT